MDNDNDNCNNVKAFVQQFFCLCADYDDHCTTSKPSGGFWKVYIGDNGIKVFVPCLYNDDHDDYVRALVWGFCKWIRQWLEISIGYSLLLPNSFLLVSASSTVCWYTWHDTNASSFGQRLKSQHRTLCRKPSMVLKWYSHYIDI